MNGAPPSLEVTQAWSIVALGSAMTQVLRVIEQGPGLPAPVRLAHALGSAEMLTSPGVIDHALALHGGQMVILCAAPESLRIPGSGPDLAALRPNPSIVSVRSPMEAVVLARQEPHRQVVMLGTGFESGLRLTAHAVVEAHRTGLLNVSFLVAHLAFAAGLEHLLAACAPKPAALLIDLECAVAAGLARLREIAALTKTLLIATPSGAGEVRAALAHAIRCLEEGKSGELAVLGPAEDHEESDRARQLTHEVFRLLPAPWRGLGSLPRGGYGLRPTYRHWDAEYRFGPVVQPPGDNGRCAVEPVVRGQQLPSECISFASRCTAEHPLGASMAVHSGLCRAFLQTRI